METLDANYWENRYKSSDDPWDLGVVSPPIKAYFDQIKDKSLRILIPGGGNSYEAEYLFNSGFKNVYVVDFAETALNTIASRVPNFPKVQLIQSDFFELNMEFDVIVEQTFFCALDPKLRSAYVKHTNYLLSKNGMLVGLLFNKPLNESHPPFGGHKNLYQNLFEPAFEILTMEDCYNSIDSRVGKELFFKFLKK
nr:methyltransferase domain-containing protein [uncultured Psychroserpens sp.]